MWNCAACAKLLPDTAIEWIVIDGDSGEEVSVGSDCGKRTRQAGTDGYTPENSDQTFYTKSAYENLGIAV